MTGNTLVSLFKKLTKLGLSVATHVMKQSIQFAKMKILVSFYLNIFLMYIFLQIIIFK